MTLRPYALALVALAACTTAPPVAAPRTSAPVAHATSTAPPTARPAFENPGGMWMPEQLAAHAETLKRLGLAIDPSALTDPTSNVLGAIVSLGGCSASFVSPDGLILTNHHCVQGALQYNATPENDLIKNGYLAPARNRELWAGPTARVFVTRATTDVTARVLDGIAAIPDDRDRYKTIERRQKELVAACEKGKPGVRCTVARYFDGAQYHQIEQLEIRDVRLAYAPDVGIGNFGGEVDNWRWPRQAGDFSFYRAYVGPNGEPADHADANVPYHPPAHLRLASKPLTEGDLVFVAGYPGKTNRLTTVGEAREAVSWFYPRRLASFEAYIDLLDKLSATDKDIAIKAAPTLRGLNNYLTNTKGQLDGLVKGGLLARREAAETELRASLRSQRAVAGNETVLDKMEALRATHEQWRERDATLMEAMRFAKLFSAASAIVRMAEERPKPDAERDPEYQERNWKRLEQAQQALEKQYNRTLDRELFALTLTRSARLAERDRSELVALVAGPNANDAAIDKATRGLYGRTKIEDTKLRLDLLRTATAATLAKSADPMIRLAVAARPLLKGQEERDERYAGAMALLRPAYIAALRTASSTPLSPDANGTLRITYGTVRGYRPSEGAAPVAPFTTISSLLAKQTGIEPFNAPARLIAAAQTKKFGPYADARLGDLPVDFLADLHITGGNSGSATLNARGELVGAVFDGNYEAMASDWLFVPAITRSIHVDLRYIEWVMDAVDGADALLREMGAAPAIP